MWNTTTAGRHRDRADHIQGVPKVVMNETVELIGAQAEAAFVEAMLKAAA